MGQAALPLRRKSTDAPVPLPVCWTPGSRGSTCTLMNSPWLLGGLEIRNISRDRQPRKSDLDKGETVDKTRHALNVNITTWARCKCLDASSLELEVRLWTLPSPDEKTWLHISPQPQPGHKCQETDAGTAKMTHHNWAWANCYFDHAGCCTGRDLAKSLSLSAI